MAKLPRTIDAVDVLLDMHRDAYLSAEARGDLDAASRAWNRLDVLLDHRLTLPREW